MKNKKVIFSLIGIFVICFVGLTVFFGIRSIKAHDKMWEYFDIYRLEAETYIQTSPEISDKYGKKLCVKFDNSVSYSETGERNIFNVFSDTFNPQAPKNLDEFNKKVYRIEFEVDINGDPYEIIFVRNDQGILAVSSLELLEN